MTSHFAQPLWLWPLAGLGVLALLFGAWAALRPGVGIRVIGQKPLLQGFGMLLMLLGLGLGLAQPRWGLPEAPRLTAVALLDVSRSMAAQDAPGGSRFEAATAQLQQLFREPRPGLRWGLSLLSGDEIPLLPPGEDRSLLRDALSTLTPGEVGSPGSSFGRVIPQVAAQIPAGEPTILLLISDGEETWEAEEPALQRAIESLKLAKLPLYAVAVGGPQPVPVPPRTGVGATATPGEPATTFARPEFLRRLAEGSGGKLLAPAEVGPTLNELLAGRLPMPAQRSLTPTHPEAGAWLALGGLVLWLLAAGQPLSRWRPVVGLLVALGASQLQAQPLPQGVKAWLAQRALESGDLPTAQRWKPAPDRPERALLRAAIELRSGFPADALKSLESLTGQGAPRPLPGWRPRALLLAARCQMELQKPDDARALLERLMLEAPGTDEAAHDLQSLVKDPSPPPPPDPKKPPPPPPPRPSMGAQQDELEGIKQRLPRPNPPPGGVKDQ
ncbi:MAG TPA: VWA domain-containing protein [Holophagaceae bacterium]|nr:VWA domain-containing protein [Holophagaceae bacterium]